jgi:hypothetical protein
MTSETHGDVFVAFAREQKPSLLSAEWIRPDATAVIDELVRRGCDKQALAVILGLIRESRKLRTSAGTMRASKAAARRALKQLQHPIASLVTGLQREVLDSVREHVERIFRVADRATDRKFQEQENYLLIHLAYEIKIRTGKYHDALVADLLEDCFPTRTGRGGGRSTNTQLKWRRAHWPIVAREIVAGLRQAQRERQRR